MPMSIVVCLIGALVRRLSEFKTVWLCVKKERNTNGGAAGHPEHDDNRESTGRQQPFHCLFAFKEMLYSDHPFRRPCSVGAVMGASKAAQ
jgi:hypothetical protein